MFQLPEAVQPKGKVSGALSIVSAQIERHVVPDFGALPPPWRIDRVRGADSGRVAKIGRTSGFTVGRIDAFDVDNVIIMTGDARHITLNGCISIKGETGADFSRGPATAAPRSTKTAA